MISIDASVEPFQNFVRPWQILTRFCTIQYSILFRSTLIGAKSAK